MDFALPLEPPEPLRNELAKFRVEKIMSEEPVIKNGCLLGMVTKHAVLDAAFLSLKSSLRAER